ncbi:MAG: 2-oxoacid:acceptor oxidoreductase subunit alpha [Bacillota bacterium]
MDLNLVLAGEAGQGLKTFEKLIGKALFKIGFNVFSSKDYMSRVRGGHNFMSIRFGDQEFSAPREDIDILIAFNQESVDKHKQEVNDNGFILFDGELDDTRALEIKAKEICKEVNPKAANSVYAGALWQLLDLPFSELKEVIVTVFKNEKVIEDNNKLLEAGRNTTSCKFEFELPEENSGQIYLSGNEAVGMGAAAAGVKFYSAYPMTPATGILNFLATHQKKLGIAVEQAEDEIGAINMAIGASYAGTRAMTGTSGGGFSLMVEALGFAGVAEQPLVIAEVQRPGPATGMPTRTGQADLLFAVNASQDEFPLIVLAPGNQTEAFYQTYRAFELADKYQLPVIILSDQFLADSSKNVPRYDLDKLEYDRHFIDPSEFQDEKDYQRYQLNEDGISPRAYPGQLEGEVVLVDSHEHNEFGFVTEDIEMRNRMVRKRSAKLEKFKEEDLEEPEYIGSENPDYLLVSWGSSSGPLLEAYNELKEEVQLGVLIFRDIWPIPVEKYKKLYDKAKNTVIIEANSSGQLASLLAAETGRYITNRILKNDGRPFFAETIVTRLKEEVITHG